MKIDQIILRHLKMPLVHFFETSFGRTYDRDIIIIEVVSEGLSGWGEITAGENPFYNEEWTDSAWLIARDFVCPRLLRRELASASDVDPLTRHIRGHNMARGGVEAAVWDLQARRHGVPLWKEIGGGARSEIPCGVSIGIQDSVEQLIGRIELELAAGYHRIKMKIKPGWDVDIVRRVRERFPANRLMADANSAYTLRDAAKLKQLDEFYLMMIEQPLAHDDIIDHAALQPQLETPICLDESIRSAHHATQAIRLKAGRIINIKLGRVGGFSEAKRLHDTCEGAAIPVWCGGMLEAGIGRAHNVALATLPNFTLPGDVSASRRYWAHDIIAPEVEVTAQGTIVTRDQPGFGYDIDRDFMKHVTVRTEILNSAQAAERGAQVTENFPGRPRGASPLCAEVPES
jgi:O-succinylbenzoate synthase